LGAAAVSTFLFIKTEQADLENRTIITLFDWIEAIISQCANLRSLTISRPLSYTINLPDGVLTPRRLQHIGICLSPSKELDYRFGINAAKLIEPRANEWSAELQWLAKQGTTLHWIKR